MAALVDLIREQEENLKKLCTDYKYVYIYGYGERGKEQQRFLEELDISTAGFIVSEKGVDESGVIQVSELDTIPADTLIILALNEIYHNRIIALLKTYGYMNIYRAGFLARIKGMFQKYSNKGICFDNDILDIYGYKFSNVLLNPSYWGDSVLELYDFVLPYFDDWSHVDEGPYEYMGVQLEKDDIVLDCGANVGIFSAIAATKGCVSYAFEPTPGTRMELEKTANLYEKAIHIVPYALSDRIGVEEFTLFENPGRNSLVKKTDADKTINVNVTTVDDFVKNENIRIDFIKADIEGAERYMLMGAKETIQKDRPKIAICTYHLEDDKEVLENLIRSYVPEYHIEHKWKKMYAWVDER